MEQANVTTVPSSDEIDVKRAVHIATEYVRQLYSDLKIRNILLEEVELSENFQKSSWHITIGFDRPCRPPGIPLLIQDPTSTERVYKVVDVDARSGKVSAMRMR